MNALTFALQLMTASVQLFNDGKDFVDALSAGRDKVQRMKEENRDPTQEEINWLNNLMLANTDALNKD